MPYEGSDEFIVVPVLMNTTNFIIPCKPTNSKAIVTLHLYDMQTQNFIEMPKKKIKFDPTVGFQVDNFEFREYSALDCKVKLGKNEQFAGVTVYEICTKYLSIISIFLSFNLIQCFFFDLIFFFFFFFFFLLNLF